MWQKARVLNNSVDKRDIGRTIWVLSKEPELAGGVDRYGRQARYEPCYEINVRQTSGELVLASAKLLELLPEFAEDVEIIPWEIFNAD